MYKRQVYIIVAEVSSVSFAAYLGERQALDGLPVILDIAGGAEQVRAGLPYPLVYVVVAPVAGGEHDVPSAVAQSHAHSLVKHLAGDMVGRVDVYKRQGQVVGIGEVVLSDGLLAVVKRVERRGAVRVIVVLVLPAKILDNA